MKTSNLLWFFLFLLLAYYLGLINYVSGFLGGRTGKNTVEEAASGNIVNQLTGLALFGIAILVWIFSRQEFKIQFLKTNAVTIAFVMFFAATIFWSVEPFVSFRRFLALFILIFVITLIASIYSPYSLLRTLFMSMFIIIVIGFLDAILTGKGLSIGFTDREAGLRGIFLDKNGAGRFYAYTLILLVGLRLYKTRVGVWMLGFITLCLLASQSVSAFAMALGGSGIVVALQTLQGNKKLQNINRLLIFLMSAAIGVLVLLMSFEFLLSLVGRDPTLTNREIIWELLGPSLEEKRLLGYGFGAFWAGEYAQGFIERWGFIGNAHSGYFETLLHAGLVGLFVLIAYMTIVFKKAAGLFIAKDKLAPLYISVITVAAVFNYTGYLILNHNSVDMLMFTLVASICFTSSFGVKNIEK